MRKLFTIVMLLMPMGASAQNMPIYESGMNTFWQTYHAGDQARYLAAERRNTEAIINEMRAARGAPPCSMGILDQLILDRPAC